MKDSIWLIILRIAHPVCLEAKDAGCPAQDGGWRSERSQSRAERVHHGLDGVGGVGQRELRVAQVRPEAVEFGEKVADDHAEADIRSRLGRQGAEAALQRGELSRVAGHEHRAHGEEDPLAPAPGRQVFVPAESTVELGQEMKVAALVNPAPLPRQSLGPANPIGNQGTHAGRELGGNGLHGLRPPRPSFFAGEQDGVEKERASFAHRLECHEVEDGRTAAKPDPEPIDEQHEGTGWELGRRGLGEEDRQRTLQAFLQTAERASALGRLLGQRQAVHQRAPQETARQSARRTPGTTRSNPPGAVTVNALPPPPAERAHRRTTTRRLRVSSDHTREILRPGRSMRRVAKKLRS